MSNNIKYDMTFADVLNEIFDTYGWYQGEDFANGVYIQIEEGEIRGKEFSDKWFGVKDLGGLKVTWGVTQMTYRRVYTQPDVMRKI